MERHAGEGLSNALEDTAFYLPEDPRYVEAAAIEVAIRNGDLAPALAFLRSLPPDPRIQAIINALESNRLVRKKRGQLPAPHFAATDANAEWLLAVRQVHALTKTMPQKEAVAKVAEQEGYMIEALQNAVDGRIRSFREFAQRVKRMEDHEDGDPR
jgi:hypothetical protein